MFAPEQVKATEERFRARRPVREVLAKATAERGLALANPPANVARRKARLAASPAVATPVKLGLAAPTLGADLLLERTIGRNDMFNVNVLAMALAAARAVGRVRIRKPNGHPAGWGTGFLVSAGGLLMTNNHVLPDARIAEFSLIDFLYEDGPDGEPLVPQTFALRPSTFFLTSVELDFTLVAVADRSQAGNERAGLGFCHLIEALGKVLVNERVNIVQHPNGDRKRIVMRQNKVIDLLDLFIHYEADTDPGSSGAPVFNDQWEVVALHHSGVPKRDAERRILTIDGGLWDAAMGDEAIDWIANEGVRVSQIVQAVRDGAPTGNAARELRVELLDLAKVEHSEELAPAAIAVAPGIRPIHVPVATRVAGDAPGLMRAGPLAAGAFTVEVTVKITPTGVAAPAASGAAGRQPAAVVGPAELPVLADVELDAVLDEAKRARKRPYYDKAADAAERNAYYADLGLGDNTAANFDRVHQLLMTTHRPVAYAPARHLYAWIDLQPNRMLRSIYSKREFDPDEIIKEDFELERLEQEQRERLSADPALRPEVLEAMLEAAFPYNCEHVVPQSWFGKREPMRGDLHHLFTCEWGCNSFRGNTAYFDFPDFEEKIRDQCGRREVGMFEPSAGKGEVARATLYFLLRYPAEIGDAELELQHGRLATLLRWHDKYPPSDYELHRNRAIAEKQGNRNPLIDQPAMVRKIDFEEGFG